MNQYPSQDPWGAPPQQPQQPQQPQYPAANPGYQQYAPPQPQQPQYAPPQQPAYPPPGGAGQFGQSPYAPQQQPQAPYGQPQYAQPQYAQPQYAPPGGFGPPVATAPRPNRTPLFAGIAVVVALAIVGFLVVRAMSGPSFAGTWYGPGTITSGSTSAPFETFLDLKQDGSNITGSGELCVNSAAGAVTVPVTITGTANGSSITMTWKPTDTSSGSNTPAGVQGTLSNGTMSLTARDTTTGEVDTMNVKQGDHAAYTAACSKLPPINPNQ